MYKVEDFIKWALTHINPDTIPAGAKLPLPIEECGKDPLNYLFGSVFAKTSQPTLDRYFVQHYSKKMSRAEYDKITANWSRTGYATDCQGLCDAHLTEQGEKTDINAHMNYTGWCTDKGKTDDIDRPFVIGEAVFMQSNSTGKMTHVGWVCGYDADGEPLVVEARGLRYGVVVTKLSERKWTHRGLMTKKFDYESEENMTMDCTKFEVKTPMLNGEGAKAMQFALNANGYTDANGNKLAEDGKWGSKSQAAFEKLLAAHSEKSPEPPKDISTFCVDSSDGRHKLKISIAEVKAI